MDELRKSSRQSSAARDLLDRAKTTDSIVDASYDVILSEVRERIRTDYASELAAILENPAGRENTITTIENMIAAEPSWSPGKFGKTAKELAEQLYEDMAGFGCISQYLRDPRVEEINCNRWDDIEILTATGWSKAPEHFISPEQCADMARKMARLGGIVLDGKKPIAESYITAGVRISAAVPPVASVDAGAFFSVRKQGKFNITRSELINGGTATDDILDFLVLCLNYGVSLGVAGATGAGKTTDIDFLCRQLARDKRFFFAEDTRELTALHVDERGNVVSRIVSAQTRLDSKDERDNVTREDLLNLSLRFTPDVIVPAEMRGAEARQAVEAARTGHTTLTTLHADNALDAYTRILTMYSQADANLSESLLMRNIVKAFPIMAFKRRLVDGSRKYVEVVEAVAYNSFGELETNTLFEYVIYDNIYNEDGTVTVDGEFKRGARISDALATRLLQHGAPAAEIKRFASPTWRAARRKEASSK